MTDEKRTEIARLTQEAHLAAERLKVLGMQNAMQSPDEKLKQAVSFALARAEAVEAETKLTKLINTPVNTPSHKPICTRTRRPPPRTFPHFPEEDKCPVCGTNDDGETVLVPIDGTGDGRIAEAQPIHLVCAIADHYERETGHLYRWLWREQA